MRTGEDCIDDLEFRLGANPPGRNAVSGSYESVAGAGGLKGSHDGSADGDDAVPVGTRRIDCRCSLRRD